MNANMYCDILKQSMIPSLQRLGRRAVFQHEYDPKTHPKEAEGKGNLWGILKRKVEERMVSNIHQLRDHSLLYIVAKCCHMKIYNTIFTKM